MTSSQSSILNLQSSNLQKLNYELRHLAIFKMARSGDDVSPPELDDLGGRLHTGGFNVDDPKKQLIFPIFSHTLLQMTIRHLRSAIRAL